jgi:site-specific recombinase XerD
MQQTPEGPRADPGSSPPAPPRFRPRKPVQPQNLTATTPSDRRPIWLRLPEMTALLALPAAHPRPYYRVRDLAVLALSYEYGLRACEVGRILLSQLNLTTTPPELTIRGAKRGTTATYTLSAHLTPILLDYLRLRRLPPGIDPAALPPDQDFLFPAQNARRVAGNLMVRPIGNKMVNTLTKRYLALLPAAPPAASHHSLRHSLAVHLTNAGVGINYIKDRLRHKSIASTQIYAQVSDEARRALTPVMEHSLHIARPPVLRPGAPPKGSPGLDRPGRR